MGLFYNLSFTAEDKKKIKMYKQQVKREAIKREFTGIEDYLASLELKMTIYENDESIIPRMSQMSQKTNQFNLTTKRYTESDSPKLYSSSGFKLLAFDNETERIIESKSILLLGVLSRGTDKTLESFLVRSLLLSISKRLGSKFSLNLFSEVEESNIFPSRSNQICLRTSLSLVFLSSIIREFLFPLYFAYVTYMTIII